MSDNCCSPQSDRKNISLNKCYEGVVSTKIEFMFLSNSDKTTITKWINDFKKKKEGYKNCLLLFGPPGIGKTALIQNAVANAFNLPFHFISLGGATDSSTLEGFDYTEFNGG